MTLRPGFPERTNFEGRLKEIWAAIHALQATTPGSLSADADNTYLTSGDLILSEDGAFRVALTDGTTLMVLDDGRLRFNRSDGTRQLEVTPAGGMKFYEANGTTVITTLDGSGLQVGSDVVADADGFHIAGGDVRAQDIASDIAAGNNFALTTSIQTIQDIAVTTPAWANTAIVRSVGSLQMTEDVGAAPQQEILQVINDPSGANVIRTGTNVNPINGQTVFMTVFNQSVIGSPPSTITVRLRGRVNISTNSTNVWLIATEVTFLR